MFKTRLWEELIGGITFNAKTGTKTYTFQGWDKAVNNYNGGGVTNYGSSVKTMVDNSKTPNASDYVNH